MWAMLPIVGGAAIAKKITKSAKTNSNVTLSFNNDEGRRKDDEEDDFEEEEGGEDDDFENIKKTIQTTTNNNDNKRGRRRQQKPQVETGEKKSSIEQLLPSINVEEILSTLKKENFALECELGMMSATLEEETLRADALEEDLNDTRQTLQAVVERDTLSETGRLQDKLALAQDELILLSATAEEEFKKNDELREELNRVQNTLDEVVKREMATVRENEDLLRRSKFEINEELMIQNRKIETLAQAKEQLEGTCATYETRIEKAKIEFEETLKKYSEANRINVEKIQKGKEKELDAMGKELEETKAELLRSLNVIDELREELVITARAVAERGGGGSTNTTADDRDRESEHALYVANLAETIDEKEDEIQSLLMEISTSKRREESLREKVVSLSAEKVQRQQRGGHARMEDSFDDLSSTIDEEMLKTESSKVANSASKASPSGSGGSPTTRRFGGLFGRNNNNNNNNSTNRNNKQMSGSDDRVGPKNVSPSPLSAFAKDANEALLTPLISAMTPPTPPNVGSSATKRTKVLPSEMKDMQQKVQELVAKVDGATTPQGISNALRELEELQQKLSEIEFTPDSPSPLSSSTKGDVMMVTPPPTTSFSVNMSPSPPRSTRKSDGKQQQKHQNRSVDDRDENTHVVSASVAADPSSSSTTKETTLAEPWLGKSPTGKIKPLKKCTACQTGFPEPGKQFCMHCLTPPNRRGINEGNNTTTPPKEALEKKKKKMKVMKMFSPKGNK